MTLEKWCLSIYSHYHQYYIYYYHYYYYIVFICIVIFITIIVLIGIITVACGSTPIVYLFLPVLPLLLLLLLLLHYFIIFILFLVTTKAFHCYNCHCPPRCDVHLRAPATHQVPAESAQDRQGERGQAAVEPAPGEAGRLRTGCGRGAGLSYLQDPGRWRKKSITFTKV